MSDTYTDDTVKLCDKLADAHDRIQEQDHTIRTLRLQLAAARVKNPLRGYNFHAA